jgi:hypothetical protein
MDMVQVSTKVLLPEWLLRTKSTLTDNDFKYEVLKYLVRYKDYQLQQIEGDFAICIRTNEVEVKRRKKRG